jgi:hypothetical protein
LACSLGISVSAHTKSEQNHTLPKVGTTSQKPLILAVFDKLDQKQLACIAVIALSNGVN